MAARDGGKKEVKAVVKKATKKPTANGRNVKGQFAPGNDLWTARSSAGPKPKFATADDLWAACCEYFSWMSDRPLIEVKPFAYEGKITMADLPHMRAMTLASLCVFLDVDYSTWDAWRSSRPDLSEVITRVERIIFAQKFEGAAAGLLNSNIISRELGLADKKDIAGVLTIERVDVNFVGDDGGEA
ncbi:terminase small subunit [Paracoccus sp. SM22M-07]|uniref:terminase small subunit n=1 Tax=Paracoccus sp. SM22M-07 TaxID=1520813 RepID=UPI0009FA973D|nr:terminase small subunit [Paracoccus sp. SM22M-07]